MTPLNSILSNSKILLKKLKNLNDLKNTDNPNSEVIEQIRTLASKYLTDSYELNL